MNIITIRCRLYPNAGQLDALDSFFRCLALAWNLAAKEARSMRSPPDIAWFMRRVDAWRLHDPRLRRCPRDLFVGLADDFRRSFVALSKVGKKPRYRRDLTRPVTSFRAKYGESPFSSDGQVITLPYLGAVKARLTREIIGTPRQAIITRDADMHYYACLQSYGSPPPPHGDRVIGIDLGLKHYAICSNGYVVDRPSSVDRRKQIIKRLNKAVLRRSRGSSGWKAGKIAIAQQHDAIRRAMDDFVEKLTTFLCRNCCFIAIEDLDIKEMTSSKRLAQNIMTASWGKFMSRLEQKCSSYGVILIKIGRYYPSTQVCSSCGYRNPKAAHLECRTWTCPSCGATHDRDLNAAKSIKKEGLRLYRLKRSQYGK